MKAAYSLVSLAAAALIMTGCGGNKLDVTQFQSTPADKAKIDIPEVCMAAYNNAIPKVAVVNFTNNSTFGKAEIQTSKGSSESQTDKAAVVGVGVTPMGVGAVAASTSKTKSKYEKEDTQRSVNAKVAESVASAVEAQLVEMGGAKIYSRNDMEKVMKEQRFQQSGLASEETLVELGKVAGVKYIITGSINNVKQKYVAKMETSDAGDTGNKTLNQLQALGNLAIIASNIALSGMTVETELNVKIIDVETGEMVFAKNISGTTSIGDFPNPNFDQLVGGLKTSAQEALRSANADLSKYFKVRGYVIKLKSNPDGRIALVNIGDNMGVKEGQEFFVYGFEETEDPMSGKVSCDMTKLPISLMASDQITKDKTWTTVEGDNMSFVRIGQLVERKPVEQ